MAMELRTRHQSSTATSSVGMYPMVSAALLNNMSTRPNRSPMAANKRATVSASVMSVAIGTARSAASPASSAVSLSAVCRRPTSTTDQPSSMSASAQARPTPLPAPVITETLSAMRGTPCAASAMMTEGRSMR